MHRRETPPLLTHTTHKTMTNTELTLDQLQTINGGFWFGEIVKAFLETVDEIETAKETGEVPERVNDPWFVEPSVKGGGCEDPNFPSIG